MHYKNGREAKVGDAVIGTCFNTKSADDKPRIVSGTLVSLTPGTDACSAMVGFCELLPLPKDSAADAGKLNAFTVYGSAICRIQGDQNHGSGGMPMATIYKQDYSECKLLMHAEDCWPKDAA